MRSSIAPRKVTVTDREAATLAFNKAQECINYCDRLTQRINGMLILIDDLTASLKAVGDLADETRDDTTALAGFLYSDPGTLVPNTDVPL